MVITMAAAGSVIAGGTTGPRDLPPIVPEPPLPREIFFYEGVYSVTAELCENILCDQPDDSGAMGIGMVINVTTSRYERDPVITVYDARTQKLYRVRYQSQFFSSDFE